ncbi:SLATT domain-containing protein [uncultured Shewanella sp.]|uniref:SLATT domain-containing protein n=1 Tax=uncultured Shewanella sp. TaxID=173975 RepID=UPI0026309BD7|nr:SLATT domain-containing protein [uncultured Shewanella sp.]
MNHIEVMNSWLARTRAVEKAHFKACVRFRKWHYIWGGATIFSASLATTITALSESESNMDWFDSSWGFAIRVLLALFVPVFASLTTFLNFNVRSKEHHYAAAKFSSLKRDLSIEISKHYHSANNVSDDPYQFLKKICRKWNHLTETSPALYKQDWNREIEAFEEHFIDKEPAVRHIA